VEQVFPACVEFFPARIILFVHIICNKSGYRIFARQQHIDFVEDSSNSEENIRGIFSVTGDPLVEKAFPAAADNMHRNIERFRMWKPYRSMVNIKRKNSCRKNGEWQMAVENA
jgi:hypothetical protein